jgi:hypothetical protein
MSGGSFNPGGMVPTRLVRSWQKLSGSKGGATPRIATDVTPVVVIDDMSHGGYPASLRWHCGGLSGPVAAQFSTIAIQNNDTAGRRSVVTVDRIWWQLAITAGDVFVGVSTQGNIPTVAAAGCFLTDMGEPTQALGQQLLPNVGLVSAFQLPGPPQVNTRIPHNDILPHELRDCQFTLGPQMFFVIQPTVQNVGLQLYAEGRYYPEP